MQSILGCNNSHVKDEDFSPKPLYRVGLLVSNHRARADPEGGWKMVEVNNLPEVSPVVQVAIGTQKRRN